MAEQGEEQGEEKITCQEGVGGRIWPLDQILISVPMPGGSDLAAQCCTTNFGGMAPSSLTQAAAHYVGAGEYFPLSPHSMAAALSQG